MKYLQLLWPADSKSRWFVFQVLIYGVLIIFTTLYSYARLDFVRSYDTKKAQHQNEQKP